MSGITFGNVPIIAPFGRQDGISLGSASLSISQNEILIQTFGFVNSFSVGNEDSTVPHGINSLFLFGSPVTPMEGVSGLNFRFGSVPIVAPTGLRI